MISFDGVIDVDDDNVDNVVDSNIGAKNVDDYVNLNDAIFIDDDDDDDYSIDDDVDDDDEVDDENLESNIENINEVVPYVGMLFDSLDEAEFFYRGYGRSVGFEIIIRTSRKHLRSNDLSSRLFICRKGGRVKKVEEGVKRKRTRDVITRTNCRARMSVVHKVKSNKWEVTVVKLKHNHVMVTPDKVQFMQKSRNIDSFTRLLIELFNKSGIETPKVMKYLSETCNGVENLGFSSQDMRNVIRDIRRRVFDSGDAECGLVLLRDLKKDSDGKFFYRVDVDEENRVRGLLWVVPRSLNAYKNFGDVVTFESTYRTNRNEKETSYKWVLKTWLEVVDNKPPITIITDQDIALGNAIVEVMPNTNYTYCTWYISSKFPEKLSSLYTQYSDFKADFNACVYKSLSPTEFECGWEILYEKYILKNHVWLNEMYTIRRQWVFAYTKQYFVVGMTTTSRSESMNSFFDEYVKASTGLKEFIENSQKALETQYIREVKADFDTDYTQRTLFFNSSLEIHASTIYTKEMFKRFQHELLKSGSFIVKKVKEGGSYFSKMYLVEKSNLPENCRRSFCLTVSMDKTYSCACKKFEHSGMICRHMIRYLNKKQETELSKEYIKLRWTMIGNKVGGSLPYTPPVLVNVIESQPARYSALCKAFQGLGASGSCSVPRYKHLMSVIEREGVYK